MGRVLKSSITRKADLSKQLVSNYPHVVTLVNILKPSILTWIILPQLTPSLPSNIHEWRWIIAQSEELLMMFS